MNLHYRLKNIKNEKIDVSLGSRVISLPARESDEAKAPKFRWPRISENERNSECVRRLSNAGLVILEPIDANLVIKLNENKTNGESVAAQNSKPLKSDNTQTESAKGGY